MSDDDALFRAAVGPVRPLRGAQRAPAPPRRRPPSPVRQAPVPAPDWSGAPLTAACPVAWRRDGVPERVLRALRGSGFHPRGELDLHGLRAAAAQRHLGAFVDAAVHAGERDVRIIHGRGRRSADAHPVLKNLAAALLRAHPAVLAFVSAGPHDGGTGALRVRLKAASGGR